MIFVWKMTEVKNTSLIKLKFEDAMLLSICSTVLWIYKYWKCWSPLCYTILSFKKCYSNQYQTIFYSGGICAFFYHSKILLAEFKWGCSYCSSCKDEHHSCQTYEVTSPEMVKKIHKMLFDGHQLKVCKLVDMVDFSKSAIHCILIENLHTRKLYTRWLPHLFSMEHKTMSWGCFIQVFAKISLE